MRSHPWQLLTLVALCSIFLQGCAALKMPGEPAPLAPAAGPTPPALDTAANTADPFAGISRALKSEPTNEQASTADGQIALARLCERRGENEQAEQMYRSLLQKTPQDGRLHHRLGVLAIRRGDFPAAEEHLRTAQSLAPANADLLSDVGYCYYLQQRLPEAEQALNEALKLSPMHAAATNNLALVMGGQGRFKEALSLFRRVNSEAEAYANIGYVLAQYGDVEQAKQMYLRALTLNSEMRAAAQAMVQIKERDRSSSNREREPSEARTAANEGQNSLVLGR